MAHSIMLLLFLIWGSWTTTMEETYGIWLKKRCSVLISPNLTHSRCIRVAKIHVYNDKEWHKFLLTFHAFAWITEIIDKGKIWQAAYFAQKNIYLSGSIAVRVWNPLLYWSFGCGYFSVQIITWIMASLMQGLFMNHTKKLVYLNS